MTVFYSMHTLFDLTKSRVLREYFPIVLGFKDAADQSVDTEEEWKRSRNQQRNWETIIQLLSLRAQPNVRIPIKLENQLLSQFNFDPMYGKRASVWHVIFSVESANLFTIGTDPTALLRADFDRIPLIAGLTESVTLSPSLIITNPPGCNTVFASIAI
jgi:hypothetical protein